MLSIVEVRGEWKDEMQDQYHAPCEEGVVYQYPTFQDVGHVPLLSEISVLLDKLARTKLHCTVPRFFKFSILRMLAGPHRWFLFFDVQT